MALGLYYFATASDSTMIKKLLLPFLLLITLLSAPLHTFAQEGISRKKQEKTLAKDAKKEKKTKAKQEKRDRKRHLSVQDKAARKRIRRHTKRADRGGSGRHREGFFRRTFGK